MPFGTKEFMKFYQKLTLEIKKKSTYLVKVPFFPLIPFHIKKNKITPHPKKCPVLIIRSFVRPVVTLFRLSDTLLNFARTGVFISEL
jgi:hypothetical protein